MIKYLQRLIFFALVFHSITLGQILFESNFDSGNLRTVTTTDSVNYTVTTHADIVGRWFYFKMKNVKHKYVSVTVSNSDATRPMYSYDNINWERFTSSESPSKNIFRKTYTSDSVYVAYYIPYSVEQLNRKFSEWKAKPHTKIDTIGYSEQNRPMLLLTATDESVPDSLKIFMWMHGRTHPSETPSSYHLDGMVDFFLSDNEIAGFLRKRIKWFILPSINPDGVFLGKSRVNSNNVDLERQWNLPDSSTPKEVRAAKLFLLSILSKKNIKVALNMHSQVANYATFWIHTAASTSDYFYRREMQFSNLQAANSPYIPQIDFSYSTLQQYFPEGWMWANWRDSIMALTYETPYTRFSNNVWIDNNILNEFGRQSVMGIMEYLELNHPKWFALDNKSANIVGSWLSFSSNSNWNFYGDSYLYITPSAYNHYVEWNTDLLNPGKYLVYAMWQELPTAASNANYEISTLNYISNKIVNQKINGGLWHLLDSVNLNTTDYLTIKLSNKADGTVVADAIRVIYAGTPTKVYEKIVAEDFSLMQNFPNPFNASTRIRFNLRQSAYCNLTIFDLLGRKIVTLNNEQKNPGSYEIEFDASRIPGGLASGVYLASLRVGNEIKTIKMTLVK
jgi:hypothetical protein